MSALFPLINPPFCGPAILAWPYWPHRELTLSLAKPQLAQIRQLAWQSPMPLSLLVSFSSPPCKLCYFILVVPACYSSSLLSPTIPFSLLVPRICPCTPYARLGIGLAPTAQCRGEPGQGPPVCNNSPHPSLSGVSQRPKQPRLWVREMSEEGHGGCRIGRFSPTSRAEQKTARLWWGGGCAMPEPWVAWREINQKIRKSEYQISRSPGKSVIQKK